MKKLFILSFASILLLTGCGATETLSCSYQGTATNGTTNITYDIDHEEDEIKKVRITYKYDFDNDNTAPTYNDVDTDDNNENNTRTTTGNNNTGTYNNDNATLNDNMTNNNTNNNNGNTDTNANNTNNDNDNITTYNTDDDNNNHTDGVGTGTDGTTNDSLMDDDGVIDGVVGSAIDTIVGGVTDIILDSAGLRERHTTVQNTYGDITGFSIQNTNDVDDNYTVTYVIDYDSISDNDLSRFNLSRDLDDMRSNYVNQGFTCK